MVIDEIWWKWAIFVEWCGKNKDNIVYLEKKCPIIVFLYDSSLIPWEFRGQLWRMIGFIDG